MDAKLTIKLDQDVIALAKMFAKKKNTSLSRLIEQYLEQLTSEENEEVISVTPLVKSLSGVVHSPENSATRKSYLQYLKKKYEKR